MNAYGCIWVHTAAVHAVCGVRNVNAMLAVRDVSTKILYRLCVLCVLCVLGVLGVLRVLCCACCAACAARAVHVGACYPWGSCKMSRTREGDFSEGHAR